MNISIQMHRWRPIFLYAALVAVFGMLLLSQVNVQASAVTIDDQAGVLNAGRVQAEAAKSPVPMLIFTTKTFSGDQNALNQYTRNRLPGQKSIDIGIDIVQRHLSIEAGTGVQLSDSQANDALSAFRSNYNGEDYTGATIAAIDSVQNALSERSSGSGITPLGVIVAIALSLVLIVVVVIAIVQSRVGSNNRPPLGGGKRRIGALNTPYPYYGGVHTTSTPSSGSYGGGAGGGFGGGFGGGAGGSF